MAEDYSKTYASLERIVQNVLDKAGLLRTEHEVGIVVENQTNENRVLVQSLTDDVPPQYVTSMVTDERHIVGDKVLMQYLNRDINNRVVIGTMSKGFDSTPEPIDYSKLPVTPMRLYRESVTYSPPTGCGKGPSTDKCPDVPRVVKIVYGEGDPLEWHETYGRNGEGRITSITTVLPPNESVKITNFIVRNENGFMDYYGPEHSGGYTVP